MTHQREKSAKKKKKTNVTRANARVNLLVYLYKDSSLASSKFYFFKDCFTKLIAEGKIHVNTNIPHGYFFFISLQKHVLKLKPKIMLGFHITSLSCICNLFCVATCL